MGEEKALVERLLKADRETRARLLRELTADEAEDLDFDWPAWVHQGQEPPPGDDWLVWLMLAGRGFGKTRAGAEWVSRMARDHPGCSIALVAANLDEARRVMIEGRSGLLAVARPDEREATIWEPSRRRLQFASGAVAFVYSGAHGDSLRGPEHHFAWCDELAKWAEAQAAWDNLMLTLRLGDFPHVLVTTTPRPIRALKAIIGAYGCVQTGGASAGNPHNSPAWLEAMERQHAGTTLGRQELAGEMIDDLEGALWTRALIAKQTIEEAMRPTDAYVVVGVDPPAVAGTCGIVACGLAADETGEETGYVLADCSVSGVSPEGWALRVAAAAARWGADLVVAEANNGGRMVEAVLRGAGVDLPVKLVHAAEGKVARAAPVAALFESGQARFAGRFAELEEELCGLIWDGAYEGPGRSPDRADAMVWAMTELMLGEPWPMPRIRVL